jgi:hypothetical protein
MFCARSHAHADEGMPPAERLIRFLNALGCDVRITVSRPHPRKSGAVTVLAG